jgi:MFS family permease
MSRRQRLTLLAAICGSAVATIDGSIVNVALPAIEHNLGGGLAGQQWVANAYLLSLGSLILLGCSLGDVWGERRVFTTGIAAFGAFSLPCALAPSISLLVAARALQGAAGALVTPSSLAIIVAAFPPAQRSRAVGSWTAWGGMALIAGPHASWRWIFALNVPLVLTTLVLIGIAVPGGAAAHTGDRSTWSARACARSRSPRSSSASSTSPGTVERARRLWRRSPVAAPRLHSSSATSGGSGSRC